MLRSGANIFVSQILVQGRCGLECGEYKTDCFVWTRARAAHCGVLHVGNLTRACKNSLHVYTTQCLKSQYLMNPLFMAKYPQQNNIRHSTTNFCTITQWPSSNFAWPESLVRIHVQPGPAHHRHLGLGAFQEEPPSVQILSIVGWLKVKRSYDTYLNNCPIAKNLPVPFAFWNYIFLQILYAH